MPYLFRCLKLITTSNFRIVQSKKAREIIKEVDEIITSLNKLEADLLENWKITVSQKCEELLKLPLFSRRSKCNELQLNFHPEVKSVIWILYISF